MKTSLKKPIHKLCLLLVLLCFQSPLIAMQAEANSSDDDQDPFPLHTLIKNGQDKIVRSFVKKGFYAINLLDEHGKTPLDYATPNSPIYNWLLKKGAQSSQQNLPLPTSHKGITHPSGDDVEDSKEADPGDTLPSFQSANHTAIKPSLATQSPQPTGNDQPLPPLTAYYQKQATIPGILGDAPQSIKDCYIRLSLTTQQTYTQNRAKALNAPKEEEDEKYPDDAPQSQTHADLSTASLDYNQLYQVKVPIDLEDLWKTQLPQLQQNKDNAPAPNQPIRHITLVGEAGSGKTTLTQRIAYQWAHQTLWQKAPFDWLLVIPLRNLYGLQDFHHWQQSVAKVLNIPGFTAQNLAQHFENPQQKGLLILDGYDEIAHKVQKAPEGPLAEFIHHCLNLPHLHLLLTSRPVQLPNQLKAPRDLHVIGFQQAEIDQYVKAYFSQNPNTQVPETYSNEFLTMLKQKPHLHLLSHTPLYLRLFCLLAKENPANELAEKPLPQLYEQLIERFVQHAWHKKTGNPTPASHSIAWSQMELAYLSYLAFLGMENAQAAICPIYQKKALQYVTKRFPRHDLSQPSHWQRIRDIGLLQNLGHAQQGPKGPTYFAHLTLQEFLAARFLAESFYTALEPRFETAQKVIRDQKYTPRYQVMIPFVAGQLYSNVVHSKDNQPPLDSQAIGLLHFWELLNSQPRELSGIHHAILVMRCLEACNADTSDSLPQALRQKHTQLLQESGQWLTAFWQQAYEDTYFFLPLAEALHQGCATTHKVLAHPIIEAKLLESFGTWQARDNDSLWRSRYKKLKATPLLAFATQSQQAILQAVAQRFKHQVDRQAFDWIKENLDQGWLYHHPYKVYSLLATALQDKDSYVRREATSALEKLAKRNDLSKLDFDKIIESLLSALQDKDSDVRSKATSALGELAKRNALSKLDVNKIIESLLSALQDKEYYVRSEATSALGELVIYSALSKLDLDKLIKSLFRLLEDEDSDVRSKATSALGKLAKRNALSKLDVNKIIESLLSALQDKEYYVRREATSALGELVIYSALSKLDLDKLIKSLFRLLQDKEYYVRREATSALGELDKRNALSKPYLDKLIEILFRLLQDKDYCVKKEVAWVICELAKRNALSKLDLDKIIKSLLRLLQDKKYYVRREATSALEKLVSYSDFKLYLDKIIESLLSTLEDKDEYLRKSATRLLGSLVSCSDLSKLDVEKLEKLIESLFTALQDEDYYVQHKANRALEKLFSCCDLSKLDLDKLIEILFRALQDKNCLVREKASYGLSKLFSCCDLSKLDLDKLIKSLFSDLQHKYYYYVKKEVAWVICKLAKRNALSKPYLDKIIESLLIMLQDKAKYRVHVVMKNLCDLVSCSDLSKLDLDKLIKSLFRLLQDKDSNVRTAASIALGVLAKRNALSKPDLDKPIESRLRLLQDKDYHVRREAKKILRILPQASWQAVVDRLCIAPLDHSLTHFSRLLVAHQTVSDEWIWIAQALLRYSPLVVVSQQARQLPGYKALIKALIDTAQAQNYPIQAYQAIYLQLPTTIQAPLLRQAQAQPYYYTALHKASQQGDSTRLQELCTTFPDQINHAYNPTRSTPLLWAAQHHQWEAVKVLVAHGAWIDATDLQDIPGKNIKNCYTVINYLLANQTAQKKALLLQMLRSRTLFPRTQIEQGLQFVAEKCYDSFANKPITLGKKAYRKALLQAVAPMVGLWWNDLENMLNKNRSSYEAAARKFVSIQQEAYEESENIKHVKLTDAKNGGGQTSDFLRYRSYLLFRELADLARYRENYQALPDDPQTEKPYDYQTLLEIGKAELQTLLTSLWDDTSRESCIGAGKHTYNAWAKGMIARLADPQFPTGKELSIPMSSKNHCIYLSISKGADGYAVRLDNRYDVIKKKHPQKPQGNGKIPLIQPFCVAFIPHAQWPEKRDWLQRYVAKAGELCGDYSIDKHLYQYQYGQAQPAKGALPEWIQNWPWFLQQTSANNCFMSSHNMGYRIRLQDDTLYDWLIAQEIKKLFDLGREMKNLANNDNQGTKLLGQSPALQKPATKPTEKIPSHEALMKGFAQHLGVSWQDVYIGIAVEQAFVRFAGIDRSQEGAMYRRMNNKQTYFILALDDQDARQLAQYYIQHFPHLHLQVRTYKTPGFKSIIVDTQALYHQVAPALGHAARQGYGRLPSNNNQNPQITSAIASAMAVTASHVLKKGK